MKPPADALKLPRCGRDVSSRSNPQQTPLFNLPNVVVTPHLGAATTEAQENVAP
jgi:D-3-phosphoglycerate dehydrogenase